MLYGGTHEMVLAGLWDPLNIGRDLVDFTGSQYSHGEHDVRPDPILLPGHPGWSGWGRTAVFQLPSS